MLVWFLLESVPWWMPSGGLRTNEKFCNLDQWQKQVNTSGKQPDLRIVQSSGRILFLRSLQTVSILIHADFMAVSFSVGTSSSPLHQPAIHNHYFTHFTLGCPSSGSKFSARREERRPEFLEGRIDFDLMNNLLWHTGKMGQIQKIQIFPSK